MNENDPGRVEWGWYVVEKDRVILTDETGEPLVSGRMQLKYERKLNDDLPAETVARQLIMQRYKSNKRGSNFNRPITFPRGRVV